MAEFTDDELDDLESAVKAVEAEIEAEENDDDEGGDWDPLPRQRE